MKINIPMESTSMGSRVQKKLKSQLVTAADKAIDRLLKANPNMHEGDIKVKLVDYPQLTSTVGEREVSITLTVTSGDL